MSNNFKTGRVTGVNGNMVNVAFDTSVMQNEVAFVQLVDGTRLKSEVIRVRGREADMQVFENTNGIKVGDLVEFSGMMLSVELGPGLLTQVYDGLQNPLPKLAENDLFLKRGTYIYPLDDKRLWEYTPVAAVGSELQAGDEVGWVPEGIFRHRIMIPFAWNGSWKITWTIESGSYGIRTVAVDTRAELRFGTENPRLTLDVLVGYPRALGIEIAVRSLGAQLIVAHHPLMNCKWLPVQTLREDTRQGKLLRMLVRNDIAAICMHTNLDIAAGGVNDVLARALCLEDPGPLGEENLIRAGRLKGGEMPLQAFAAYVCKALRCRGLR